MHSGVVFGQVWTDFVQTWALAILLGALFVKGLHGLAQEGVRLGPLDVVHLGLGRIVALY